MRIRWLKADLLTAGSHSANLDKTVAAAREQLTAIRRLEESGRLDPLPDKLREAARLRLENPELNLSQLGALCDPAVSKSAFNHRMRKLMELAEGSEQGEQQNG